MIGCSKERKGIVKEIEMIVEENGAKGKQKLQSVCSNSIHGYLVKGTGEAGRKGEKVKREGERKRERNRELK